MIGVAPTGGVADHDYARSEGLIEPTVGHRVSSTDTGRGRGAKRVAVRQAGEIERFEESGNAVRPGQTIVVAAAATQVETHEVTRGWM